MLVSPVRTRPNPNRHLLNECIAMSRKGSDFAGLSVAMITPFKDGKVDYEALRAQIEFQIAYEVEDNGTWH